MTAADTTDFTAIHRCLRLGGRALALAVAQADPSDRARAQALASYWAGYTAAVLHHHTVEDEIFYPALVERVPPAIKHLWRIDADHHLLDELMAEGTEAIARLVEGQRHHGGAGVLASLDELMWAHLDYEDDVLVPMFAEHFSREEYEQLAEGASKGLGLREVLFTVPFVGSWVDDAQREHLLGNAPLAFRLLYRLTRKGHDRMAAAALGDARFEVFDTLDAADDTRLVVR